MHCNTLAPHPLTIIVLSVLIGIHIVLRHPFLNGTCIYASLCLSCVLQTVAQTLANLLMFAAKMVRTSADGSPLPQDIHNKGVVLSADNATFKQLGTMIKRCLAVRKEQPDMWNDLYSVILSSSLRYVSVSVCLPCLL